jgi:hypothetical protein
MDVEPPDKGGSNLPTYSIPELIDYYSDLFQTLQSNDHRHQLHLGWLLLA